MTARSDLIHLLTKAGHSPATALEIAIDFERGSVWASEWIATLKKAR